MAYLSGNIAQFTVNFTTAATGALVDPTTVVFSDSMNYGATMNTWTYSGASTPAVGVVARLSTGIYSVWVNTTGLNGLLIGDWLSTGTGAAHTQDPISVGSSTGTGLLFADLVENVFRRVMGPVQQRTVSVNQTPPIGSNDSSFIFSGPQSPGVAPGVKLSIDMEDMYVLSVTGSGPTYTANVVRGYGGSYQSTHNNNALVYINSRVTRFDVGVAINDDLNDLSGKGLFRVGTASIAYQAVFRGYDLSALPSNYDAILSVETRTVDPYRGFPVISDYTTRRFSGLTDTAFPSGNALILNGEVLPDPGMPMYVTYSAPFLPLVNPTDGVMNTPSANDPQPPLSGYPSVVMPNMPYTALDLPPLGATIALIQPQEISRNDIGPMPDSAKAADVAAQAIASSVNALVMRRDARIAVEADRLYVHYPNRRY